MSQDDYERRMWTAMTVALCVALGVALLLLAVAWGMDAGVLG